MVDTEIDIISCKHCGATVKPGQKTCAACGFDFDPNQVKRLETDAKDATLAHKWTNMDPVEVMKDLVVDVPAKRKKLFVKKPVAPRSRIQVNRGYGQSMGNMVEVLSGQAAEEAGEEHWIEIEETAPGEFEVVGNNMTEESKSTWTGNTALGFVGWDTDVEDNDAGSSDESQCFHMSDSLQWKDVHLSPKHFTAPSIDRLKEALQHVVYTAWCPGDI